MVNNEPEWVYDIAMRYIKNDLNNLRDMYFGLKVENSVALLVKLLGVDSFGEYLSKSTYFYDEKINKGSYL